MAVKMFDVDDWQPEFAYMVIKFDDVVCDGGTVDMLIGGVKQYRPCIKKMLASDTPNTPVKSKAVFYVRDKNGEWKHKDGELETETKEGIIEWTIEGDDYETK